MEKIKQDRLSELTRISRERTLTDAETAERAALREEYLEEWRQGARAVLDNTYIVGEDGEKRKLREKKD